MVNKTILSFLCSLFMCSEMKAFGWRSKRKQAQQKIEQKQPNLENIENSEQKNENGTDEKKNEEAQSEKIVEEHKEDKVLG